MMALSSPIFQNMNRDPPGTKNGTYMDMDIVCEYGYPEMFG